MAILSSLALASAYLGLVASTPMYPNLVSAHSDSHSLTLTERAESLPAGWSYVGCMLDSTVRVLPTLGAASSSVTRASCISLCGAANYPYAGVEFGNECWCGRSMTQPVAARSESDCNVPCAGEYYQISSFLLQC